MNRSLRSILATAVLVAATAAASACGSRDVPLQQLAPADLWSRAEAHYDARQWGDAIRYYDRFIVVGGADPRVNEARFKAAQAYYNRREYVTAATRFSSLAADLGRAGQADEARFMACRSYRELAPHPQLDQEYTRAAIDHCQALIDFFPESPHAGAAREIVDAMWDRLAAKDFEAGDWFFRRRAYDSAIIYFNDVIQLYPRTDYAPRALARLVEVYEILDWDDERDEARQELLRRYPESPEARRVASNGSG